MNTLLSHTALGRTALACIETGIKSGKIAAHSTSDYLQEWKRQNRRIQRSYAAATLHIISSLQGRRVKERAEKSNQLAIDILRDLQIASITTFRESLAAAGAIQQERNAHTEAMLYFAQHLSFYQKRQAEAQVRHIKGVIRGITHELKEAVADIKERAADIEFIAQAVGLIGVQAQTDISKLSQPDAFCKKIERAISRFEKGHLHAVQRYVFKKGEEAHLLHIIKRATAKNESERAFRLTFHFDNSPLPKTIALLPSRRLIFDVEASYEYESTKELKRALKRSYFREGVSFCTMECLERAG